MFPVEARDDGIYVGLANRSLSASATVTDVMAETMVNWGLSNGSSAWSAIQIWGLPTRCGCQAVEGNLTYHRHPP